MKLKLQLSNWRNSLERPITDIHQELSNNWKTCAIGERIRKEERTLKTVEELTPEAKLLGYDFSLAVRRGKNNIAMDIAENIENISTIWKVS